MPSREKSKSIRNRIAIAVILLVFCGIALNTIYQSRKEHVNNYDFVITRIDTSRTEQLEFYSADSKISLWNYNHYKSEGFREGDSIHKGIRKKQLRVYRKINGKYKVVKTLNPGSMLWSRIWDYE